MTTITESNEITAALMNKKRGRKPKEKVLVMNSLQSSTNYSAHNDDTLIFYLPIQYSKIAKQTQYMEYISMKEPEPFSGGNTYCSISNDLNIENESNEVINNNMESMSGCDYTDITQTNDEAVSSNAPKKMNRLLDMMIPFQMTERQNRWVHRTNVCCHWCCEKFENIPIGLPVKIIEEKYYVIGVFCSFECAAAYNFDMNDEQVWDRYTMLNTLYNEIQNSINNDSDDLADPNKEFIKIKPAPNRYLLDKFGGPLTIDEFRKSNMNYINYNLIYPPLISVIPQIEEVTFNTEKKFVPMHEEQLKLLNKTSIKVKPKTMLELSMGISKKVI